VTRPRAATAFVQVTSPDGTAHLVAYRLYESGLVGGEGRYAAVCGRTVLAASLACAPGRSCPLCTAGTHPPTP
jgi:hypothetical protein